MKFQLTTLLLFFSLSSFATVLESSTECRVANSLTEISVNLDEDENATLEIAYDQTNIENQNVVKKEYKKEIIDAFGTMIEALVSEYTTSEGNFVRFVRVGENIQGFIQGPFTDGEKVGLFSCRRSLVWDF